MGGREGEAVRVLYTDGTQVEGVLIRETKKAVLVQMDLGILQIDRDRIDQMLAPKAAEKAATSEHAAAAPGSAGSPDAKADEGPSAPAAAPDPRLSLEDPLEDRLEPEHEDPEASEGSQSHEEEPVIPPMTMDREVFGGRLIDRYSWAQGLAASTVISLLGAFLCLMWAGFGIGCRICDIGSGALASFGAALLWTIVMTGLLFVNGWTPILLGGIGLTLMIAWFVTAKGVLGSTWFQTFSLGVLFVFAIGILFLLVEVGQHLLELPTLS